LIRSSKVPTLGQELADTRSDAATDDVRCRYGELRIDLEMEASAACWPLRTRVPTNIIEQ